MSEPESSILLFAGGAVATFLGIVSSKALDVLDRKWQRDHERTLSAARSIESLSARRGRAYSRFFGTIFAYIQSHRELKTALEREGTGHGEGRSAVIEAARERVAIRRYALADALGEALVVASEPVCDRLHEVYGEAVDHVRPNDPGPKPNPSRLLEAIRRERGDTV